MKVVITRTIKCEEDAKEIMEGLYYQELFDHKMIKDSYLGEIGRISTEDEIIEFSICQ